MNRLCSLMLLVAGIASAQPVSNVLTLETRWRTETGGRTTLAEFQHAPYVLAFIYTSCPSTCPLTTMKLKRLDAMLEKAGKPVDIVVVSLDPIRDTPDAVAQYRARYSLEAAKRWHILVGEETQLRTLTMLLGFKYLKNVESGAITHDNSLYVIGQNGNVIATSSSLDASFLPLVEAVPKAARAR